MNFLRAIGFSNIENGKKLEKLLNEVIEECDKHSVISLDEKIGLADYLKIFGKGFGIVVKGSLTEEDKLIVENWDIYTENTEKISIINSEAHKIDNYEVIIECEDKLNGNNIIFSLQNTSEFIEAEKSEIFIDNVSLSAFSNSGKIIFPIYKNKDDLIIEQQEEDDFRRLLALSREGDENALQTLELQKSQCEDSLIERLENEDLFSIVESCFIPTDINTCEYRIIGDIIETQNLYNNSTGEEITFLTLDILGTKLNLYINSKDLEGFSQPNMRFYGTCCLLGNISFLNNKEA